MQNGAQASECKGSLLELDWEISDFIFPSPNAKTLSPHGMQCKVNIRKLIIILKGFT